MTATQNRRRVAGVAPWQNGTPAGRCKMKPGNRRLQPVKRKAERVNLDLDTGEPGDSLLVDPVAWWAQILAADDGGR